MKYYWGIAIVLFVSCQHQTKKTDELKVQIEQDSVVDSIKPIENILVENKIKHAFSLNETKDEFHVYIKGDSIINGIVVFTISNEIAGELYHEEFAADDLIGWGMIDSIDQSISAQEEYIKKRINEFFDEENFTNPALKSDEEFDANYSDQSAWSDIQSDQTAIGFTYYTGKEDGRWIAFSKKQKKVVLYVGCC